jgi:hypothetical protein
MLTSKIESDLISLCMPFLKPMPTSKLENHVPPFEVVLEKDFGCLLVWACRARRHTY